MENSDSCKEKPAGVIVPMEQISKDALKGLVSEFILREGTDYGVQEVSFEKKYEQVVRQLKAGHIFIVYDPVEESCSILRKEALPRL